MRRSISLRTYFSIYLGIIILLISVILSLIIGNKSTKVMKNEIGESLEETAYQMADKMDAFMWSRSGEIYTLSSLIALQDFSKTEEIQKLLEDLKINFPSFSWIGLTDSNGTVIASTQRILSGENISERPVFKEGKHGKFLGDVHDGVLLKDHLPNPSGEDMKFVDVSVPITDADGEIKGVLAAHLSWEWAYEIEKSILEPLDNRSNIEMFVVSGRDNIILLGCKEMIGKTLTLNGLDQTRETVSHWSIETWEDDKEYLTGFTLADGYMNYEGMGWTIVIRQPLNEAYTSIRELQFFILLVGSLSAIIFSGVIWFVAKSISFPIKQISTATENLRVGKKVQIPQYSGIKEIEMLSVSLRELVNSLMRSENALDQMEAIAQNDYLTGIPNRVGLDSYLELAKNLALQNNQSLLFLCLDLDGFKNVNDSYGHHAGDTLLKDVAKRLRKLVNEEEIVARLGGDEFTVVVQSSRFTKKEEIMKFADRIIEEINAPFIVEGLTVHVGCSIGIDIWNGTQSVNDVLKTADTALYASKNSGKNKVTFHNTL